MISPAASPHADADDQPSFLASIGHELRNPLSCILAQAETLQDGLHGPVSPAQQTVLQSIQENIHLTLSLVADLADLGRIEANVLELKPTPCSLLAVQQHVIEMARSTASERSLQLNSIPVPFSLQVTADEARMRQIIFELLSAVMLSAPVGGMVSLSIVPTDGSLLIRAGNGLTLEELEQQTLAEAEDSLTATVLKRLLSLKPLGITLLRKLVHLLGGTFTAHATSKTVCLKVTLPLGIQATSSEDSPAAAQPPAAPAPTAAASLDRAPLILLADDQPTLVSVTTHYLENLGFEVHSARDGQEAIQKAADLKPDLILMDVRMPVLDGPQAIQAIRSSEDPSIRAIPIISVSGQSGQADRDRCLTAGANAHLAKPFGVKELDQAIRQFVSPPDQ